MSGIEYLKRARSVKNDEFYTMMDDISNEINPYRKQFKDKVVFCNCDDPYESNFFKYFVLMFNTLGLKKLICTCWNGSPITGSELPFEDMVVTNNRCRTAYKIVITEVKDWNGDGAIDLNDVKYFLQKNPPEILKGNGDFRSDECIKLLEESDIVVTNPPFSLFREYIALLMKYDKKFLIIGNQNAITYKEIFPLIRDNKMWLGMNITDGKFKFMIPNDYNLKSGNTITDEDGNKCVKMNCITWFTNLPNDKRNEKLILYKHYDPDYYPEYDNYDAINVDKVAEIPDNYDGVMGVPITFLNKYCPKQFKILELGNSRDNFTPTKDYINPVIHYKDGSTGNGGAINRVLAIAMKERPVDTIYYTSDNSDYLVPPYARILIRKIK